MFHSIPLPSQSLLADGAPDPDFGENGTVMIKPLEFRGAHGTGAHTLAAAAGDRPLLAGAACRQYGDCDLVVIQYRR